MNPFTQHTCAFQQKVTVYTESQTLFAETEQAAELESVCGGLGMTNSGVFFKKTD